MARWEEKLPAVLRGEIKLAGQVEVGEFAGYCATFEQKYALATRFVIEQSKADPGLLSNWTFTPRFAGWAIQAGAGHGADASTTPLIVRDRFRRLALEWCRELLKQAGMGRQLVAFDLRTNRNLAPVRDPVQLALLPPDERAEWEKFWEELGGSTIAPAPRAR